LQIVVAALCGNGRDWLEIHSQLDPLALPHWQLRQATLAAMSERLDQKAAIKAAQTALGGWIQSGLQCALKLYELARLAQAWYLRFRTAKDWYEAFGSWHMHLDFADLRHRSIAKEAWDLLLKRLGQNRS
jgi:hypothetical protein